MCENKFKLVYKATQRLAHHAAPQHTPAAAQKPEVSDWCSRDKGSAVCTAAKVTPPSAAVPDWASTTTTAIPFRMFIAATAWRSDELVLIRPDLHGESPHCTPQIGCTTSGGSNSWRDSVLHSFDMRGLSELQIVDGLRIESPIPLSRQKAIDYDDLSKK